VPCPRSRIHVEQLVAAVPPVVLELDFRDAGVLHGREQAAGRLLDGWILDGLDKRARVTELQRVLPRAARGDRRENPALDAQRAVRELGLASAGNQLLDHDHVGADEIARFVGTDALVPPTVFELADDPLAAAVLAGRSGVSPRRLLRLPLLRSAAVLAGHVSNRLTALAATDRWSVGR